MRIIDWGLYFTVIHTKCGGSPAFLTRHQRRRLERSLKGSCQVFDSRDGQPHVLKHNFGVPLNSDRQTTVQQQSPSHLAGRGAVNFGGEGLSDVLQGQPGPRTRDDATSNKRPRNLQEEEEEEWMELSSGATMKNSRLVCMVVVVCVTSVLVELPNPNKHKNKESKTKSKSYLLGDGLGLDPDFGSTVDVRLGGRRAR